jgi:myo-inositol-1(or 4)-monophosphatase
MAPSSAILSFDWLELSARCAASLGELLAATTQRDDRVAETGTIGAGGDRTLVIDEQAEEIVFAELKKLFDAGARFTALSEERGTVDFGSDEAFVVIDPIDGSLNAKRGLPAYSISIAVADGPTMADVGFGFVHDFGSDEQWHAIRGEGALNSPIDEGQISTMLCHLGNIAYRTNTVVECNPQTGRLLNNPAGEKL